MSRIWDFIAKIVMIGDSACGKSSLMIRLTDDRFTDIHDVTIAAEIGSKVVKVGDKGENMKLQIWDTAGQEHFRAVTRSYFRNAAGCILVYDITRRETFEHAQQWLEDIRSQAEESISLCLVGNKSDLEQDARQVSYEEAAQWAQDSGISSFVEASAKTGDSVVEAYDKVAREIYSKIVAGKYNLTGGSNSKGIKANTNAGLINLAMDERAKLNGTKSGCC